MKLIKNINTVEISAVYSPPIKTIKQVMHETGRMRQQIERNKKLTFGIVLDNKDSGDIGVKVIVDDEALKAFIKRCNVRDKEGKEKPQNGKAKRGTSLDDFLRENDLEQLD